MALKSGLLSETTWAVDVLAVLLRDDVTIAWFGLQHLPGLTEVLLEHFRRCLIELFPGDFDDLEVMCDTSPCSASSPSQSSKDSKTSCGDEDLLSSCSSKLVHVETDSPDEEVVFDDKRWDVYGDVDSFMLDWQLGRGDLTTHIQTHFNRLGSLDFAGNRFFGWSGRPKLSIDDAAERSQEVGGVDNQRTEHSVLSSVEKIATDFSNFSGRDKPGTVSNLSTGETFQKGQEVSGIRTERNEHSTLSSVEKIAANCSSSSGKDDPGTVTEHLGISSSIESAVSDSLGSADKNKEHLSLSSEVSEPLESSYKEKFGSSSGAETVPSSDAMKPLATGCKHEICRSTLASEDADDDDRKWLRLELKRLWCDGWEKHDDLDQDQDPSVLYVVADDHQQTSSRCLALSNVIRGLSFIPGNDLELARHPGVVATLSRLLLFRHQHSRPGTKSGAYLDDIVVGRPGFDVAELLREDALVTIANIAGQLELACYPEEICVPVLDGLLHWASCRTPCAVDPLPSASHHRDPVSAQRLALEALCKLCVTDANVDLLLATPPFDRVVSILGSLLGAMANPDCDQVWREFAIIFASSLVAGDPGVARALALHRCTIPVLVGFVEAAVAESAPSAVGTSADMVRRATAVLCAVAELPEGRSDLARNYQSRLLQLAVASSLDSAVLSTYAHILHICSGV